MDMKQTGLVFHRNKMVDLVVVEWLVVAIAFSFPDQVWTTSRGNLANQVVLEESFWCS